MMTPDKAELAARLLEDAVHELAQARHRAEAYAEVIHEQKAELEAMRCGAAYDGHVTIERRLPPPARGQQDHPYIQDPEYPLALMPAQLLERLIGTPQPQGTRLHITIRYAGQATPPANSDGTPLAWTPL